MSPMRQRRRGDRMTRLLPEFAHGGEFGASAFAPLSGVK